MITEEERAALIAHRLLQAKETSELALFLIESNKLTLAVNRIYYCMYYALTALALKNQYETSKHGQLIGWFNKEFVSTGKVDRKYGKMLRSAYQNRTKGDYDAFVYFSKDEVEHLFSEMSSFLNEIMRIAESQ